MRRAVLLFATAILVSAAACSGKKKKSKDEQIISMLRRFFTVGRTLAPTPSGLWVADRESVAALIEKKYLSAYRAKPDEMQAGEIRERLKSLVVYYRIENDNIAMLTTVADSVGVSAGKIAPQRTEKGGAIVYAAQLRGKNGSLNATVRYFKTPADRLEYEEEGLVIKATRETRSADELVQLFQDKAKSFTGLMQY